jgi:hypothetical protein
MQNLLSDGVLRNDRGCVQICRHVSFLFESFVSAVKSIERVDPPRLALTRVVPHMQLTQASSEEFGDHP